MVVILSGLCNSPDRRSGSRTRAPAVHSFCDRPAPFFGWKGNLPDLHLDLFTSSFEPLLTHRPLSPRAFASHRDSPLTGTPTDRQPHPGGRRREAAEKPIDRPPSCPPATPPFCRRAPRSPSRPDSSPRRLDTSPQLEGRTRPAVYLRRPAHLICLIQRAAVVRSTAASLGPQQRPATSCATTCNQLRNGGLHLRFTMLRLRIQFD